MVERYFWFCRSVSIFVMELMKQKTRSFCFTFFIFCGCGKSCKILINWKKLCTLICFTRASILLLCIDGSEFMNFFLNTNIEWLGFRKLICFLDYFIYWVKFYKYGIGKIECDYLAKIERLFSEGCNIE